MDFVECVMLMNYLLKLYDVILFVFVFLAVIIFSYKVCIALQNLYTDYEFWPIDG